MENILTSVDLMQGHRDLVVDDFERGLCDDSKPCQNIPISMQGWICATIKVWSSQISIFCCDLENRFKVKWVACQERTWWGCLVCPL